VTEDHTRASLALLWLRDADRVAREFMARCMCPPHFKYTFHLLCPVHVPRRLDLN